MKIRIPKSEYLKLLIILTAFTPIVFAIALLIENILHSIIAIDVLNGMWIGLLFAFLSGVTSTEEFASIPRGRMTDNRKNAFIVVHWAYGILIVTILYFTNFLLKIEPHPSNFLIKFLNLDVYIVLSGGILGHLLIFWTVVDDIIISRFSSLSVFLIPHLIIFVIISVFISLVLASPFILTTVASRILHGIFIWLYFEVS